MLTVKLVEHAVYQQIRTKLTKYKINTIKLIHFRLLADLVERFTKIMK